MNCNVTDVIGEEIFLDTVVWKFLKNYASVRRTHFNYFIIMLVLRGHTLYS